MSDAAADIIWMQRALHLAERGLFSTTPNPRVGCVLVKDGQSVGEGWHPGAGQPHAEVFALNAAGLAATGATAYVTLEPCSHFGRTPPCADALIAAGVARVVVGCEDPNPLVAGAGIARLRAAGIDVTSGVLADQAEGLNLGFMQRMRTGLPWVRAKLAHSIDGRTAMESGESFWITGAPARADVQYWRARSCALITGADTLLMDQARMQVRLDLLAQRWPDHPAVLSPLRGVVDSRLRVPADHPFYAVDRAMLFTGNGHSVAQLDAYRARGVAVVTCASNGDHLDLLALLRRLVEAHAVNEVMIEAGAELTGAFYRAGLIQELILYCAPRLLGSAGRPLMALPLDTMADAVTLDVLDRRQFGADQRIIARLHGKSSHPTDEVQAIKR
ncbi:bifunctional diaminohydroxyphosphoribosylaminopyrimidine deaminase/5-amino-6-(5-phosphoribosylamino)uracil reductase RibD [Salinispirillum sp. LH 10-3-1]|uniref:Riboflavin biosynthesis protein RibD n=1 Tax=Salinispirillum sp. LH 10-3-1 TaxID=2952525 RepID=A0AB38YEC3_9GAMM